MAKKIKEEELLNAYVESNEGRDTEVEYSDTVTESPFEGSVGGTAQTVPHTEPNQKTMAQLARENRTHGDTSIPTSDNGVGLKYRDNVGWLKIDPTTLPTKGIFYPDDTVISIRAARGVEIKHWSTMNDNDVNQLSRVDDIFNYMIEKCCNVKMSGKPGNCWKDLKNADRFYLLLAIKEFTFIDGENELMVPISECKEIPVVKEMIDFIDIPEELMDFYDSTEKCFIFECHGAPLKIYIPSIGVNEWLKKYAAQKVNSKQQYDEDFFMYAPLLIKDYRTLSVRAYEEMVGATQLWGIDEWSILSDALDLLNGITEPKIKYTNEDGGEVEIPLTFRGGLRALFVLPNKIRSIRRS